MITDASLPRQLWSRNGASGDGTGGTSSAGGGTDNASAGGGGNGGSIATSGAAGTSGSSGTNGASGAGATSGTSSGGGSGSSGAGGSSGSSGASRASGAGGTGAASGAGGTGAAGGSGAGDLVVTTNADENDAGASVAIPGGTGLSLREAITIANAAAGEHPRGVVDAKGVANGVCMTIAAGPTTVDGLAVSACPDSPINVTGGNDVHISNCTLTQSAQPLIIGTGAGTGAVVGPGNLIRGGTGHCVALYSNGIAVLDNRIMDCGTDGIFISGKSANTTVIGNLIVRTSTGIGMGAGATGTVMWFNTVVKSVTGIGIGQATTNDLRNNIVASNSGYGVVAADAKFTQQDYNLLFGNASGNCSSCIVGTHSVLLDPKFVDATADDCTLQASSPAINAGTPLASDRNGNGAGNFNGAAPDLGYREAP